eukprot:Gb_09840 [translate_table: standard]
MARSLLKCSLNMFTNSVEEILGVEEGRQGQGHEPGETTQSTADMTAFVGMHCNMFIQQKDYQVKVLSAHRIVPMGVLGFRSTMKNFASFLCALKVDFGFCHKLCCYVILLVATSSFKLRRHSQGCHAITKAFDHEKKARCLLVKRVVKLGLVDHRIGVRCPLYNEEGGFVHVVNLLAEVIPVYNQSLRDWEVQGDGSQLGLAEGPSVSNTTRKGRAGLSSRFVSGQRGWVYLILWRIPWVIGIESESSWPVCILQAMLEHGSLISSGRAFEP